MHPKRVVLVVLSSILLSVLVILVQPVLASSPGPSDNGIEPVEMPDLPNNNACEVLGYDFETKIDPPSAGTYPLDGDPFNTVTISTDDGVYFDWTSTIGIDAVVSKGGPSSNVYFYAPEALGDGHLHSPLNSSGKPAAISHISFCYDYEVDVSKTAEISYVRTFDWDIEKTVTPSTWDLFSGDSGTSAYTVAVTKDDGTDSDWAVEGTITIENNTPFDATITGVTDVVSGGINAAVTCGVSFPYTLVSGATLECTYETDLPDGSDRMNTATAETNGVVGDGTGEAEVTFGDPTTLVNDTVNVTDTMAGDLGSFSDDDSVTYEITFSCDADEGTHNNTATIEETGDSDDASVTVNCYDLTVTKDADTSFNRYWTWTIDKSADQTELLLSEGQMFQVNYEVEVSASSADDAHTVTGDIQISNPHPTRDASLTAVADVISPAIAATVNCPSLTVPAGGSLTCTYSANLPDEADRTNTATASLQNYDYASDGTATAAGTTDFSGSAAVNFSDTPDDQIDECVDVSDTNTGPLGTICANEAPKTFTYSLWFGTLSEADVVLECGDNTHHNTADFETNDTGTTGEDTWTVNAMVVCDSGCTLTPGYWKTHSEYGPAPYDDTWASLTNGANTVFFLSGKSYYGALWTPPQGNAYYILAHAYIAAQLNQINGAFIPSDVLNAFNQATTLLSTYTPNQIGALKGNKAPRPKFIELAGILDNYNNGLSGPGHCSE